MKRREFIALLGGATVTGPLTTQAQQPHRVARIGVMVANAESDPIGKARIAAFRHELRERGWEEGRNLRIECRWAASAPGRAQAFTKDLLAFAPQVIVANGTPALAAVHHATNSIPVVFVVVVDPVGAGYVHSLARPGGNITGFSSFEPEIGGKWLELLKEVAPGLTRVAVISDPNFRGFAGVWHAIESLGPRIGLKATGIVFRDPTDDVEGAIRAFAHAGSGGLIIVPTAINNRYRNRIISVAAHHRLPAVYPFPLYAISGGLMSYGIDTIDLFRRGASYVDRILRGEKPADLPVQAPTKYELLINLKTARALGLTVPPALLARANEVIE